MDVDDDALARFERWYADRHGPDLLDAGFFSAQAYHCRVGSPLVCNVYEIPSSEIFYTDAYNSKRTPEHDPDRPWILDHVSNRSNTAYAQVVTVGVEVPDVAWADDQHLGRVESPWISTVRFDIEGTTDDHFMTWFEGSLAPEWQSVEGLASIRLMRQSGRLHPSNPSTEPEWSVLLEWSAGDVESGPLGGDRLVRDLAAGPAGVVDVSYDVAELTLSLRRGSAA
jgi:hypothetical protein